MSYRLVKINGDAPQFLEVEFKGDMYKIINHVGGYHFRMPQEIETIKDYGDDFEEAWSAYLQEHGPKPSEPVARLDWISPEGKFYPCAYCAHQDLADRLMFLHYGSGGNRWDLGDKGWGKILAGLVSLPHPASDAMKDTVRDILWKFIEAPADTNWFAALLSNPEGYSVQQWMTSPVEKDTVTWAKEELADLN